MSASNDLKTQKNSRAQSAGANPEPKGDLSSLSKEAASIISKERSGAQSGAAQDHGLRSVLGKKQVEVSRAEPVQRLERERQVRSHRGKPAQRERHENHAGAETLEHERMEQINLRRAQNQQNVSSRTGRAANTEEERVNSNTAWTVQEKVPKTVPAAEKDNITDPTVRGDTTRDTEVANKRFGVSESPESESEINAAGPGAIASGVAQGLASMREGPVPLASVVGPEAVLTFQEKLKEVWVYLDDGAQSELDVVARMPATLNGESATELLMVESPQGLHFVAFLRNKNDFEVLANFDRHELLPGNPSRQLIEAAIIAYEQLDAVFKDGSEKIGESVQKAARERRGDDPALIELRMRWNLAKRRKRRFENWIDYLLGELDILDQILAEQGQLSEAEIEAKAAAKNESQGEKQTLEKSIEKNEEIEEDTEASKALAIGHLFKLPEAEDDEGATK